MSNFYEELLSNNPELFQQLADMRRWLTGKLFAGDVACTDRREAIAWNPPDSTNLQQQPQLDEVAHSEEEMLKPARKIGDRVFRSDLEATFVFVGGNPSERGSYFRLLTIANNYTINQEGFARPNPLSLHQQWMAAVRAYEQLIPLNGRLPVSLLADSNTQECDRPPLAPKPVDPHSCQFYKGSAYLRCAVNPCAANCNDCHDFLPKSQG